MNEEQNDSDRIREVNTREDNKAHCILHGGGGGKVDLYALRIAILILGFS